MGSIIFAVLSGIFLTLQNSLNGLVSPLLGAMGASLVLFLGEFVFLISYQLIKEKRLLSIKPAPWICYVGGPMATIIVGTLGLCVAAMGSAVTTCCSVAGQIIMSAIVDHFGILGTKKNAFSFKRLPCFVIILAGVLMMNLLDGGTGSISIGYLLLAMALGSASVIVRTMNYKASMACGSNIAGGMVNCIAGLISASILFTVASGFKPDLHTMFTMPPHYYLTGVFGVGCMLTNIQAYKKANVFYATIFMLIGQVVSGIIIDILIFHALSTGKCIGIAVVTAGILLDKFISRKAEK